MEKVGVIIVNWNNPMDTLECLKYVKKLDYPNYVTIVVDNGSTDNSVKTIHNSFPDIEIIKIEKNLGYAIACNAGILRCIDLFCEYFFLLNNDVLVDKLSLSIMVDVLSGDYFNGIVGPTVYCHPEKSLIFSMGGGFNRLTGQNWGINYGKRIDATESKINEVDYISGCAFLIKRQTFEHVGKMSIQYFMYYDEIDYCIRIKNFGYKVIHANSARVWHKVSSTAKKINGLKEYYVTRNRFLIQKKFLSNCSYSFFLIWFILFWMPYIVIKLLIIDRDPKMLSFFVKGISDGLKIKPYLCY